MRREIILSPISGIVAQIYRQTGDLVSENELILQIECMKLFYDVSAFIKGKISLSVQPGEFVQELQELGTILEI